MKENGFHASNSGGKKALAISLIVALVLAAISVIGAFAAPSTKTGSSTNRSSELRELSVDRAWFNNVKANRFSLVTSSDPVAAQQYLNQYAFALTQAETLIRNGGVVTKNNKSNNNSSNNGINQSKAQINGLTLGDWLHELRGLRVKLENIGVKANGNFMNNVAGSGVPVTGGSSSSSSNTGSSSSSSSSAAPSATPTTSSSSSSSSSSTTPTATPTTSSSTTPTATPTTSSSSSSSSSSATPSATPTTSSSSSSSSSSSTSGAAIPNTGSQNNNASNATLAKVWGPQFRDLEVDRVWFNNFRSNVANLVTSDPAKTQQWLSQYAFALRQADAIIVSGTSTVMNNNNNNNNTSLSNGNSQRTSAQRDLAMWLHMMRDLQIKLTGGTVNGTTSTTP